MNRGMRYFWLDMVMGLLALVETLTSFLLWVVLPQGYYRSRFTWLTIHKHVGLALTLIAILHVVLHRRWLAAMAKRIVGRFWARGKRDRGESVLTHEPSSG